VKTIHKALIAAAVLAVPAAAHSTFTPKQPLCFASGAATYRIAPDAPAPDYRVRIGGEASTADLRMQLVDRAELADFVLVDDFSGTEPGACKSSTRTRTVMLDPDGAAPDVTIHLSTDVAAPHFKLYVHSVRFSQQDAAALLGAMWKADERRQLAAHTAAR